MQQYENVCLHLWFVFISTEQSCDRLVMEESDHLREECGNEIWCKSFQEWKTLEIYHKMFEGSDWESPPDSSFYVAAPPPASYLQWRVREQRLRKLRANFSAPSCTGMSGAQLLSGGHDPHAGGSISPKGDLESSTFCFCLNATVYGTWRSDSLDLCSLLCKMKYFSRQKCGWFLC